MKIKIKAMGWLINNNKKDNLEHHRYRIEKENPVFSCDRYKIYGDISYRDDINAMWFDLVTERITKDGVKREQRYNSIVLNNLELPYTIAGLEQGLYLLSLEHYKVIK